MDDIRTGADLARELSLEPLWFTGKRLGPNWVWEPVAGPQGGDYAYLSDMSRWEEAGRERYVCVPVTTWGDYVGSTIERSNARSLVRDYPDTFVSVRDALGAESLYLPWDADISEYLFDELVSLERDYPLYDEEDHSSLEYELTCEAWDNYGREDLLSELLPILVGPGENPDYLTDAVRDFDMYAVWREACEDTGFYPHCEDATGSVVLWDERTVDAVAELIERAWMARAEIPGQLALEV